MRHSVRSRVDLPLTLLARDVSRKTGIDCRFEGHKTNDLTHRADAMQVYRIVQEAVLITALPE